MDEYQVKNQFSQIKKDREKIRAKLKICNVQEQEEEGGEDFAIGFETGIQKNEPRICHVCNKGFSSGKALGGHMRIHVQANNYKEQQQNLLSVNKKHNDDGNIPVCSLCGKSFQSMKSLFGHMSCHPEREWRGIQPPPPPPAKNSSPTSSVSHQIDLSVCLRGWSSTAKRGRGALTAAYAPIPLAEEERLHVAVQYLMKLAHGDSFDENRDDREPRIRKQTSAGIEDKNWVFESRKRGIDESLVGFRGGCYDYPVKNLKIEELSGPPEAIKNLERGKEKVSSDCEKFTEDDETESQNSDFSIPSENLIVNYKYNGEMKSKRKRIKKLKLRDLGTPVEKLNPIYKCITCDRCFQTHQALGGHRSSHNKIRNSTTIDHREEDNDVQVSNHPPASVVYEPPSKENEEAACGTGGSKVVAENSTSTAHQCQICNKNFSTAQALGGHKRCHWTSPLEAIVSQDGSSGDASQMMGRKILGFDLNEVPAMEEVEFENHAAGYAYASSSYNSQ